MKREHQEHLDRPSDWLAGWAIQLEYQLLMGRASNRLGGHSRPIRTMTSNQIIDSQ